MMKRAITPYGESLIILLFLFSLAFVGSLVVVAVTMNFGYLALFFIAIVLLGGTAYLCAKEFSSKVK